MGWMRSHNTRVDMYSLQDGDPRKVHNEMVKAQNLSSFRWALRLADEKLANGYRTPGEAILNAGVVSPFAVILRQKLCRVGAWAQGFSWSRL